MTGSTDRASQALDCGLAELATVASSAATRDLQARNSCPDRRWQDVIGIDLRGVAAIPVLTSMVTGYMVPNGPL